MYVNRVIIDNGYDKFWSALGLLDPIESYENL